MLLSTTLHVGEGGGRLASNIMIFTEENKTYSVALRLIGHI